MKTAAAAAYGAFRDEGAWLDVHGTDHPHWKRHWRRYNDAGDACARLGVSVHGLTWNGGQARVQPVAAKVA